MSPIRPTSPSRCSDAAHARNSLRGRVSLTLHIDGPRMAQKIEYRVPEITFGLYEISYLTIRETRISKAVAGIQSTEECTATTRWCFPYRVCMCGILHTRRIRSEPSAVFHCTEGDRISHPVRGAMPV